MATEAWLGEVSAAGCRSSEVTVSLPAAVDVLPPAPDGAPAAPGGKAAASADFNRAMALLSAADGGDGATPAKDEGAPISPPSSPKAKPSGGFFGGLFGSKQPQAAAAGGAAATGGAADVLQVEIQVVAPEADASPVAPAAPPLGRENTFRAKARSEAMRLSMDSAAGPAGNAAAPAQATLSPLGPSTGPLGKINSFTARARLEARRISSGSATSLHKPSQVAKPKPTDQPTGPPVHSPVQPYDSTKQAYAL